MRRSLQICIALGCGAVLSLAFSPYEMGWIAYFALVPFILFSGVLDGSPRLKLNSFAFGFSYFFSSLYWIAFLEKEQIAIPELRLPAAIVLSAYLAIFQIITFFISSRLIRMGIPFPIAIPITWGGIEYLRSLGVLGFPWSSLGYSQTPYRWVIQLASLVGVYGISAWLVLINCGLVLVLKNRSRGAIALLVVALVLPLVAGRSMLSEKKTGKQISVALIQPNISGAVKWNEDYRDSTIGVIKKMIRQCKGTELVILPETAFPFYVRHSHAFMETLGTLARNYNFYLLVGYPDYERTQGGTRYYNSAMLVNPYGFVQNDYRKIHLVPFGEMIPFEDRVSFLKRIDLGEGDFSPGEKFTIFEVAGKKFSVAICFESIFPDLMREFVKRGARLIVNITNDEWFGESPGPYQHAQMAIVRSVECNVGIARCANTGISMLVDPYGQVTKRSDLFVKTIIKGNVTLGEGETFYLRFGYQLPRMMLAFSLICLIISYWIKRD